MVRINKIYTKVGDQGSTYLADASTVSKSSIRIKAFGLIDQLIVETGQVVLELDQPELVSEVEKLQKIQNKLFDLGAELALAKDVHITEEDIQTLEAWIDQYCQDLPTLESFVLPGGNQVNISAHKCRTTCRTAERTAWKLKSKEPDTVSDNLVIFLNRLSDYYFALSRYIMNALQLEEVLWKPQDKFNV